MLKLHVNHLSHFHINETFITDYVNYISPEQKHRPDHKHVLIQ